MPSQVKEQFISLELRLLKNACRHAIIDSWLNSGVRGSLSFVHRMPIFESFQLDSKHIRVSHLEVDLYLSMEYAKPFNEVCI